MTSPSKYRWAVLMPTDKPRIIEMVADERGNVHGVMRSQAIQALSDWHLSQIEDLDKELGKALSEEAAD